MNTVPGYRLVRKLGQGGMAEVYEAVNTRTKQHIAIKFLFPHHASDPAARMRFIREARTGMQLDHRGIVRVLDTGEHNDQPFIVMELIKGKTLDAIMKKKKLPLSRIIAIGKQTADALAAAHKQGIVHRDISPRNIMVYKDTIKVMDFGLAKVIDTTTLTGEHAILGTFYYMSPEQAVGDEIDSRSDIFSLGVVLYQMLTNRQPFMGEHAGEIIHALLYTEPSRICDIDHDLPNEVEQVVFKALQKKPDSRYQSAIDLKTDLEKLNEILHGKTVTLIASDITVEEVFEKHRGIYSDLIGREQEMQHLQGHLTRMLNGTGSAVFVSGEAGIGKSRLLWELGHRAEKQGIRYLTGRCVSHAGVPYQPIVESLQQYFTYKGITDGDKLIGYIRKHARHLRYRKEIVAQLVLPHAVKKLNIINKEQLWDTAAEIIKIVAADRPIVMHLDDLHWADAQTLEMLTYIARGTTDTRVLIIGTHRPEDITETKHPLRTLLKRKDTSALFNEIPLKRLDETGTKNIITSVFENSQFTEAFTDSIHQETDGNPLFVLEVLKLLKDERIITRHNGGWRLSSDTIEIHIPKTVSEVIHRRIDKLNRDEREIVELAAVEGLSFNSDTVIHCLEQPRMKILRCLQNLESSHNLIHAAKQGYQFDHGKIKDVIYDSLIPELRKEYHKIIGTYLEEKYGDKDDYAGKIAYHLLPGSDRQKPIPFLIKAGDYSAKLYATSQAIQYFDKTLELIDRILEKSPMLSLEQLKLDVHKKRNVVNFFLSNYDKAQVDINATLESARKLGIHSEEINALAGLGLISRRHGKYKEGVKYHKEALAAARKTGDKKGEAFNLCHWGAINWICGDYEQALLLLKPALKIHREIGDMIGEAADLYNIGTAYLFLSDFRKAFRHLQQSLKIRMQTGIKEEIYGTLSQIGWVYTFCGETKKAEAYFRRGIKMMKQIGDRYHMAWALLGMARTKLDQGKYAAALAYCKQPLEMSIQTKDRRSEGTVVMIMGVIHYSLGDLDIALNFVKQSLKISKQLEMQRDSTQCLLYTGNISFFRGDYQKALHNLEKAFAISKETGRKQDQYNIRFRLWETWKNIGNNKKSFKLLKDMVRMLEKPYSSYTYVMHQMDIAELHARKRNYNVARIIAKKGLAKAEDIVYIDTIMRGLLLLTQIEITQKILKRAKKYAKRILKLARKTQRKINEAQAHQYLAEIYLSCKNYNMAIFHAKKVYSIATHCGAKELLWKAYSIQGKAYLEKNELLKAKNVMIKAQKVTLKIMKQMSERNRKSYSQKREIKQLMRDLKKIEQLAIIKHY